MMNLIELIKNGESKTLELKETLPRSTAIAKTIIAFSNTSGGKLIVGVNDQREIVGLKNIDIFELQDKISSIIYDSCYPNILPEVYTANIDGVLVLVVEVFRGNLLPYYLKKDGKNQGTYIRIGATNRKAGFENILELERQKRNLSFDEEINYEYDFQSLDISILQSEFKRLQKTLTEEKLVNLKLVKEEQGKLYPTNGLLILLGKFEHIRIMCSRFKGTTMDVFLDKKEYSGNLFHQLKDAENFIKNHIHLKGEIKSLQRVDTYEMPLEAIREALINAVVHRDYTNLGRNIKVGIYDDMLNIVSPGGFPNTMTQQDMLDGRSEVRNSVVARVFKELNYIEQWGTGIRRIKSSCLQSGLKEPEIQETGDFVDVELYRQIIDFDGKLSDADVKVSDTGVKVSDTGVKVSDTGVEVSDTDVKVSDIDVKVSDADVKVSDTDVKVSDADVKVSDTDVKVSDIDVKVSDIDVKVSDADVKVSDTDVKVSDSIGSLSGQELQIIEWLNKNKTITSKEVESILGLQQARARRVLKKMGEKKILVRKGSARSTYYVISV